MEMANDAHSLALPAPHACVSAQAASQPTAHPRSMHLADACWRPMQHDKVNKGDVEHLVDTFPGQSIDFFGALRARVYDDRVRQFVQETGIESIGKALVNSYAPAAPAACCGSQCWQPPACTAELAPYSQCCFCQPRTAARLCFACRWHASAEQRTGFLRSCSSHCICNCPGLPAAPNALALCTESRRSRSTPPPSPWTC